MPETATCHISAELYRGDTEVCAFFRFGTADDAARFFAAFNKAVQDGTISVGQTIFPSSKTISGVTS